MRLDQEAKVPAWDLPFYRFEVAKHFKVDTKVCIVTYGGLGDVFCVEPTVRYTLEVLKPALGIESITVATMHPELFKHLDVKLLPIDKKSGKLEIENGHEKYYWLYAGHTESNLQHRFYTHNNMLPVDYPALSCLRMQLPLKYRTLKTAYDSVSVAELDYVVVHPGNHWQSKTFPKKWWDKILSLLRAEGKIPLIIGGKPGADTGTVEVDASGCCDLREKLTISESATILRDAKVLITNDSFPLHLACTGNAHIGFFATAKDPEWLMHWRDTPQGIQFGWRMENLALGGSYQRSFVPRAGGNHLSQATQGEVISWLPKPEAVVNWAKSKLMPSLFCAPQPEPASCQV